MRTAEDNADDRTGRPRRMGDEPSPEPEHTGQSAPASRSRISGAELETRFDRWRSARRNQRIADIAGDHARTWRRGFAWAMGVGAVVLVAASGVTRDDFEADRAGNAARIAQLERLLEEAQAVPDDAAAAERLTALAAAATAAAAAVAQAQQGFAELHHRSSVEQDTHNGAPNDAMTATAEHRRALSGYFAEGSYLAEDKDAYTWQNVLPFDATTEIDPRFAWYLRYDGWEASDPSAYAWDVETVMPEVGSLKLSGAADRTRVVWLCTDTATGEVLAWATAIFSFAEQSGLFDDLSVTITAAGAAHQHPAVQDDDNVRILEINGLSAAGEEQT